MANLREALQKIVELSAPAGTDWGDSEINRIARAALDAPDYESFGKAVVSLFHWWGDEWSEDIMPLAVQSGLAERVPYDPELHGDCEADPGDEMWVWLKNREVSS